MQVEYVQKLCGFIYILVLIFFNKYGIIIMYNYVLIFLEISYMKFKIKLTALLIVIPMLFGMVSCGEPVDVNVDNLLVLSSKNIVFETLNETKTIEALSTAALTQDELIWTSSDPAVATCEKGVVVSRGYGICVIKAITPNGATASCVINVIDPNLTINFSNDSLMFKNVGEQFTLNATNFDGHPINTIVTWSSSNHSVAVCEKGVIKSTGYGMCTIRAVASNGAFATCAITVIDPSKPVVQLELPEGKEQISFDGVGEEFTIPALTLPNENSKITWMSSDESVAVCENGVVRSVGDGICAIVALSADGGSAACVVNVGNSPIGTTPPEDIMTYAMHNAGKTIKHIDKRTGEVISEFIILSYTFEWEIVNGVLVITPYYHGVKTYDRDGLDGTNQIKGEFNLYTQKDQHCETKSYRVTGVKVGDLFTIEGDRFGVAIIRTEVRPFYTTISLITE